MALEQASRDWTQELHNTAAKLTSTSRALELKFAQHVKTTAAEESDIPDPVKLVRRIHALEVAARQLQESCKEIAEKRKYLLPNVAQQQAGNSEVLDKLLRDMFVLEPIRDRLERANLQKKLRKQQQFFKGAGSVGDS